MHQQEYISKPVFGVGGEDVIEEWEKYYTFTYKVLKYVNPYHVSFMVIKIYILSIELCMGIINSKLEDSGCLWEWRKENLNSSNTQRTLNKSVICKSKSKDIERKGTS